MTDSEIEHVPKPQRKPLRRLFGSLADFCTSMENPECSQCDNGDCTYDSEYNWKHTPQHADIECCENCSGCEEAFMDELVEKMTNLSISEPEEKVPEPEEKVPEP